MMNKELDEAWITIYHYNDEIIHDMGSEYVENPLKEELDIVNNALLELKAIKEAKPDKVLETLKDMLIGNGINDSINDYVDNLILPIKQALIKTQEGKIEILIAKKCGFFDGYGMWRNEDFVIDYDTVRKEFCLRSITVGYGLGKTRFYESDYKKTWWLKEDKSE